MAESHDPYSEGSLKNIALLFMKPLLSRMPDGWTPAEWLASLLGSQQRVIEQYESFRSFKMPGIWLEQPYVRRQDGGPRYVRPNTKVWVRVDSRKPGVFHAEIITRAEGACVFELNNAQWVTVRRSLTKIERKSERE